MGLSCGTPRKCGDRSIAYQGEEVSGVSGEQFSERLESEAKAIAALNHPNICQIYDVGPDFLVMEYIDGRGGSSRFFRLSCVSEIRFR
jgi:predicted Ser/Thr protein kinase